MKTETVPVHNASEIIAYSNRILTRSCDVLSRALSAIDTLNNRLVYMELQMSTLNAQQDDLRYEYECDKRNAKKTAKRRPRAHRRTRGAT